MTASPYDHLPTEVHRAILNVMDISSLAALTVTQRPNENISSFASDEVTWYSLIQRRFGIGIPSRKSGSYKEGVVLVRRCSSSSLVDSNRLSSIRKKRPMSYGGSTWKEAYRCLVCCVTERCNKKCRIYRMMVNLNCFTVLNAVINDAHSQNKHHKLHNLCVSL